MNERGSDLATIQETARRFHSARAEQRAREGRWLFRWRSYVPLPLYFALLLWVSLSPTVDGRPLGSWEWEAFSLITGLTGLVLRVWVAGFVPAGTSGRTSELVAKRLNTSGPYSLVRHPLYLGNFLMWMGPALLSRAVPLIILTPLYFWGCYLRIIMAEDRFLLDRFREAFLEWASRTSAVIPRWSHWTPSVFPYAWRTAVLREYTGLYGLAVSFVGLALAAESAAAGRLTLDRFWWLMLVSSTAFYVLIRLLKWRTSWLNVPGR